MHVYRTMLGLSSLVAALMATALVRPAHAQQAAPAPRVVPGEYIVKMKSGALSQVQGKMSNRGFLKAAFPGNNTFQFKSDDAALVQQLKQDADVEYVEPNYVLESITPTYNQQYLNNAQAASYSQSGAAVKSTEAWNASLSYDPANRPIVAVVDTGLDKTHYVFTRTHALWVNTHEIAGNGIDDDLNGYVDDVNGWNFISNSPNFNDDNDHGTHVAGIVLGATQDILQASPNLEEAKIQIMPLKFLAADGSGSTSAAINAIYYAVNNGAKVINCSWGGSAYSRALLDAMTYAYNHGVLVVTAAGNYSANNDVTPMYPANYDVPSNVSVAASSDSDRLASFSNYGVGTVPIAAPGVYVFSTMPGGYFSSLSGTSMAAPFVAGSAALALREAIHLSGYQMRDMLVSSIDAVGYLNGKVSTGGRLNSESLILNAKGQVSAASYQPSYTPDYSKDRSPASEESSSGGGGGAAGCGLVRAVTNGAGPGSPGASGMLAVLFALPALVWFALRKRHTAKDYRRFERYVMESQVVIRSGDRKLVGTLKTISLGGLSFNVDDALEKGGAVTMKIAGPNGGEGIEVEGHIVWNVEDHAYGVKFDEVQASVRETLFGWTRSLVRSKV